VKVLIVKASALGDIVHALPVLPYLKSASPQIEIDWLAEERFAPLLEGHSLIRKVHRVRTREWRRQANARSLEEISDLKRTLLSEEYSVTLDLQGNCKSGLFTFFSGAPLRYGFDRSGVREWPNLFATNRRVGIAGISHISDRMLSVARQAFPGGSPATNAGPLEAGGEALRKVDKLLQEADLAGKMLVVLHCGGTWKTKRWPLELWQELSRNLGQVPGLRLLLTWGSDDELAVARAVHEACDARSLLWPKGALPELVALLYRADLVVGGDTGPIHIAAAVGTPTVSLFRATDGNRNAPRGGGHNFIQAPMGCSPCLRKKCSNDRECGESIGVCAVLNSISLRLARAARLKVSAHA
jgi:heptosyltransferase I